MQLANAALKIGDIDRGWSCFHKARQLELLYLEAPQLRAAAMAMRDEAEKKLRDWRKDAVLRLLSTNGGDKEEQKNPVNSSDKQEQKTPANGGDKREQKSLEAQEALEALRERVFRAAQIRDEHYDNEAYKDALRRSNTLRFALTLLVILVAVLGLSWCRYLPPEMPSQAAMLLSVAIFGMLGATISAVIATSKPASPSRIPEMVSSTQITALRLLMGPASAVLIYFAAQTTLYPEIFKFGSTYSYAILIVAFAAGFSERLVLRVVEAFADKA